MKAIIVKLDMKHLKPNQRCNNSQRIYGYKDASNHGRYKYERNGILSKIPKLILGKGAFIIKNKDKKVLYDIEKLGVYLKKYEITIKSFDE
jgi:hypothetical protein